MVVKCTLHMNIAAEFKAYWCPVTLNSSCNIAVDFDHEVLV